MAWARMDDGFHDHPKVGGLSLSAVGLWTLCFTWANRHLGANDLPPGFVPTWRPGRFGGDDALIAELVDAGLWDVVDGGWIFHDFEDYLPASKAPATAAEVAAARSEAGRRGAAARWGTDSKLPDDPHSKLLSDVDGKAMPPSRPVPSQVSADADTSSAPVRPELLALCEHLADRIAANGSRRPRIGRKWHDAARLMVDTDGREPQQIRAAIDWCQDDEFWRSVILSMPKLREKYDQLRLAAQRTQQGTRPRDRQADILRDEHAWAIQVEQQFPEPSRPALGA